MSDFLREIREGVQQRIQHEASEAERRVIEEEAARRRVAKRIAEIVAAFERYGIGAVELWETIVTDTKFVPAHWSYNNYINDGWQNTYGLQRRTTEVYPLYQNELNPGGVVAVDDMCDVYIGKWSSRSDTSCDQVPIPDGSLVLRKKIEDPIESEYILQCAEKALVDRICTGEVPNYEPDLR